jgi:tetratricopeptide (TPR) repeat protein
VTPIAVPLNSTNEATQQTQATRNQSMAELSQQLHERIQGLCAEGDNLLDQDRYEDAIARYESAWQLLPEPRTDWSAGEWIMAAIGDAHYHEGDFAASRAAFMTAVKCGGSPDNPFLRLRLGQCLFELGDRQEAANWLAGAYLLEGNKLFADDDPKYLEFIKAQLEPPPGGWPEGW